MKNMDAVSAMNSPSSGSDDDLKPEYWAFISYRHLDNSQQGRRWAEWLHQQLESYEIPKKLRGKKNVNVGLISDRIYPVFRDKEDLPVDADLTLSIRHALDRSKSLIVLCSPQSAKSRYVNDEITYFKKIGKSSRILAVLLEGEPNVSWDVDKQKSGFIPSQECLPLALMHPVDAAGNLDENRREEPIAADFRLPDGRGDAQGWTTVADYRKELKKQGINNSVHIKELSTKYEEVLKNGLSKIRAGILGVPNRDYQQIEIACQNEKDRKRRALFIVFALLMLFACGEGLFALIKHMQTTSLKGELNNMLEQQYGDSEKNVELSPNEVAMLEKIISSNGGINAHDNKLGSSILMKACEAGNVNLVNFIISKGADVNAVDEAGQTVIMRACKIPSTHGAAVLEALLNAKADPNIKTDIGLTALHLAASVGNVDGIRVLIRHGVDIYLPGPAGLTPMGIASGNGHIEAVKCLIDLGADINHINKEDLIGQTPLLNAITSRNIKMVNFLIKNGVDVNHVDKQGMSVLLFAVSTPLFSINKCGENEVFELISTLIKAGAKASFSIGGATGMTVLHMAVAADNVLAIRALVKAGVDIYQPGVAGEIPMNIAAANGKIEAIKCLKELGADINRESINGNTPLIMAAMSNNADSLRFLISQGVDINKKNKDKMTAIRAAVSSESVDAVKILVHAGADISEENGDGLRLFDSVVNDEKDKLAIAFIDGGMDVNSANSHGDAPIQIAAVNGRTEVIKALLAKGVSANSVAASGWTALGYAARQGHIETTKVLIAAGAKVNARQPHGYTPLGLSAYNGFYEIVKLLMQSGADKNIKDEDGVDALSDVMHKGYIDIAELLGSGPCSCLMVIDKVDADAQSVAQGLENGDIIVSWANWRGDDMAVPAGEKKSSFEKTVKETQDITREITVLKGNNTSANKDIKKIRLAPGSAGIQYHALLIPIGKD